MKNIFGEDVEAKAKEEAINKGEICPECGGAWRRYRLKRHEFVCMTCGFVWSDPRNV